MVKPNQKKTIPPSSNRLDDLNPYYGTSLDHLVVIPRQSTTPNADVTKRAISPSNNQSLKTRSSSPMYPSTATNSNSHQIQHSAKRSSSPQESKKKLLDIDLKNLTPSFLESPKGSPRSPKNGNFVDSPRLKGSEPLGCESWEVVSKQDLDYRETLAAERFLRFLHGQPVSDAKQKFASIMNTDYLFSDNEEENAAIKFIRMEELERLMKENLPKNEKQYIYDWLNEIPQPNVEKIPEIPVGEATVDSLTNQFQSFKSIFNQMSEKIFKKWILSHRLERIVIDLVQKYQETKKQVEELKIRESTTNNSIHEIVKLEVQKQLKTGMKTNDVSQPKEMLLKEIVRNEMEKITKKADVVLSEMKERNIQKKIDISVEEAVDKILKETEEQFTFLTSSIGEIKKDVNDLKIKSKFETKSNDLKTESTVQDVEKMKLYLESKTKEFTNNMVFQLENTSNLLERCNSIEKSSEKKIKEFQTRMERELKDLKGRMEHLVQSSNNVNLSTNFEQQFHIMERTLDEIQFKKQLTEEESRRAIESIIKSNLMYSEDIHGLHIEQKMLESKFEEKEEEYTKMKDRVSSFQQFKQETSEKLEYLEMKRLDESSDIQKLSELLENVSSHLNDIEQRKINEKETDLTEQFMMELNNIKSETYSAIENIRSEQQYILQNQSNLEENMSNLRVFCTEKNSSLRTEMTQNFKVQYEQSTSTHNIFSSKIDESLTKYELFFKSVGDKFDHINIKLNNLTEYIDIQISELRNRQTNKMNDGKEKDIEIENLIRKIGSFEVILDKLRNDISKEIQMNMKFQNDSNKCIESSILNLENSRNDNKTLIQNIEQKIVEIQSQNRHFKDSIQTIELRSEERDKILRESNSNQINKQDSYLMDERILKDLSMKVNDMEKSHDMLQKRFSDQSSETENLKSLLHTKLEISESHYTTLTKTIHTIQQELEHSKQQNDSITNSKITEKLESTLRAITNFELFKKQCIEDINQIRDSYLIVKSKVEDYAVMFETSDLWKQGFNDSIVILKQKIQENLQNYDKLSYSLHDLTICHQKLELSYASLSSDLSDHLSEYKTQQSKIVGGILKLEENQHTIEENLSSSFNLLNHQIHSSDDSLREYFNSNFKSLEKSHIEQTELMETKLKPFRDQNDALIKNFEILKEKTNLNENDSRGEIIAKEILILDGKIDSVLQECKNYLDLKVTKLEDFTQRSILENMEKQNNQLEESIHSFTSFKTITRNIATLQEFMVKLEFVILPQFREDIIPVTEVSLAVNTISNFKDDFERLHEKLTSFELATSNSIASKEKSISKIDKNVTAMEEEITSLKAMMKEENNIQKKILNGLSEWKNITQEQITIFDNELRLLKEKLITNESMDNHFSIIKEEMLNKVDSVAQNLELMKSNMSLLETHTQTVEKNLFESKNEILLRLTNEEGKLNELEQNIVDIYKKIITLYGQLDTQGEAAKLMENIVGIQEVLAESHKKLQEVCDTTLDEMESHAQTLINDFYRLIDQKVLKTREGIDEYHSLNDNENQNLSDTEYQSLISQLAVIQEELLKQQTDQEEI